MKPVKQRYKHDPVNGAYGDCASACIASMLEISIEDVPHFSKMFWPTLDMEGWHNAEIEFLHSKGFHPVKISLRFDSINLMLAWAESALNGIYYTLLGKSMNGTNHEVVCHGGAIVHDPALDNSGIVGGYDDSDAYGITIYTPLAFATKIEQQTESEG